MPKRRRPSTPTVSSGPASRPSKLPAASRDLRFMAEVEMEAKEEPSCESDQGGQSGRNEVEDVEGISEKGSEDDEGSSAEGSEGSDEDVEGPEEEFRGSQEADGDVLEPSGESEKPDRDEGDGDQLDAPDGPSREPDDGTFKRVIDLSAISALDRKIDRTGLIYVARIPPGMGPAKLKYLLSKWGGVNRVYLARDEKAEEGRSKKKKKAKREKHQSFLFKEGWVEFEDKKVARRVAEMLNTRPIGGKPSDRYHSDLWSLTYLPRFKWSNLSDQIAVERRVREQLQRNSLEESKKSQDWYLKMVEKSRVNEKIREKEINRKGKIMRPEKWLKNEFRQRQIKGVVEDDGGSGEANKDGANLKSVLKNLL